MSDLHLEFGPMHPGSGEVLILSGDICTAKDIEKQNERGKQYRTFFNQCARNYDVIFYVLGNHEHYGYNMSRTYSKLQDHLPVKIQLLNNSYAIYKGVAFLGSTMWTDFNKENPLDMMQAAVQMNDYSVIRTTSKYRKLCPDDILSIHKESRKWLETALSELDPMPCVVMTHHAPSWQSIANQYRTDFLNASYCSDLTDVMFNNPHIQLWTHGHTHTNHDYMVNKTRVICNPRGYDNYELNPGFVPNYTIELN